MLFKTLGAAAVAATSLLLPGTSRSNPPGGGISADSAWKIIQGMGRAQSRVDATSGRRQTGSSRVPPGQLPPAGMCRVWIQGVPPGHQPAVTDCASAQIQSAQIANSRVIYGSQQSFPGRGKGSVQRGGRDPNRVGNGDDDGDENSGVYGQGDDDGDERAGAGSIFNGGQSQSRGQGSVRAQGGRPSWAGRGKGRGRGHGRG